MQVSSEIVIYGGGGHAKVVLDSLQDAGGNAVAIIDTKFQGDLLGVKRLAELPTQYANMKVVIAIGDNATRKRISQSLQNNYANITHPTSKISRHASHGSGCMFLHGSIIQAGTRVGNHVIVNTGAQIDHDCEIGDFVHIAPRTVLCGNVRVGEGTLLGTGTVVKPGIKVGAWAVVGSGTVVIRDIPDFAVVVGNPGRIIKYTQG